MSEREDEALKNALLRLASCGDNEARMYVLRRLIRDNYREAIEEAARVAEAAPWFVEMGPDHIRQMRGTDIAQSIRALLPKDAVSEGER